MAHALHDASPGRPLPKAIWGDWLRIRRTATSIGRRTSVRPILVFVTLIGKIGHGQPDASCAVSADGGEHSEYLQVFDKATEPTFHRPTKTEAIADVRKRNESMADNSIHS
jgi:hypothetical protein